MMKRKMIENDCSVLRVAVQAAIGMREGDAGQDGRGPGEDRRSAR